MSRLIPLKLRVRPNPSEFWKQHLAKAVQQHFDQERSLLGYVPGLEEDRDLSGAELAGAYLRHANLSSANLSGANLTGADLTHAFLRGATGLSDEQKADFKRRGAIVD